MVVYIRPSLQEVGSWKVEVNDSKRSKRLERREKSGDWESASDVILGILMHIGIYNCVKQICTGG